MSKTKGLSKKKKLLKTLIHKYLPLQVLLTVFLYAVIVFINIPINKWLTLNCQKWSSGEYHFYDAFFILPFAELLIFAIMSAVICAVYYFVSGIIAYRNYCYIPLTEDEIKKKGFKNADTIIVNASLCEPNVVSGYDSVVNAEVVKSMILIKYAGAIAEELIFGHYDAGSFLGSNSDFKNATELIKGYITMIDPERSKTLLDDELKDQLIDISKTFYQECKELLSCNIKLVEHLSNVLTYKERLTTEEVLEIINAFKESKEINT